MYCNRDGDLLKKVFKTYNQVSANDFTDFFRSYAAQLSSYRDHCDSILKEVESALNHLQDLQHKHLLVSTKTGALHEACEQLLQDQVREIVYFTLDVGVNSPYWVL